MRLKCLESYPTPPHLEQLGPEFFRNQVFRVTPGSEYLVLALSYTVKSNTLGTGVAAMVQNDNGHPVDVPLCQFEIVDPRVSSHWEARTSGDGWLTLWPPSFYQEYYHDDLSEGVPEIVADFKRVVHALSEESERLARLQ